MAQEAYVLTCTAVDPVTSACTAEAWLPAPTLLPPLSITEAGQILSAALVVFAVAYGMREVTWSIRR